jgi:hypothetical protein
VERRWAAMEQRWSGNGRSPSETQASRKRTRTPDTLGRTPGWSQALAAGLRSPSAGWDARRPAAHRPRRLCRDSQRRTSTPAKFVGFSRGRVGWLTLDCFLCSAVPCCCQSHWARRDVRAVDSPSVRPDLAFVCTFCVSLLRPLFDHALGCTLQSVITYLPFCQNRHFPPIYLKSSWSLTLRLPFPPP